ncbi:hypothetical protein [Pseudomonas lactis]|uniref:hypothetical protein n=1 Tax=Pseudomonas lactis TaxID=1615674 RepID=UPI0014746F44|nr:hypothetical protein [Pseudomonas lactis]NNA50657.1 hypothetical protein [Pseudomonas lactis]
MNNSVFFEVCVDHVERTFADECAVDFVDSYGASDMSHMLWSNHNSSHQTKLAVRQVSLSEMDGTIYSVFENPIYDSAPHFDTGLDGFKEAQELLYHWERHRHGRIASAYAVFFVEKNCEAMNLNAINLLLLTISAKQLTQWSMIALLRASFSAKHVLPAWNGFYEEVKKQLDGNPRAVRLLAGLDD